MQAYSRMERDSRSGAAGDLSSPDGCRVRRDFTAGFQLGARRSGGNRRGQSVSRSSWQEPAPTVHFTCLLVENDGRGSWCTRSGEGRPTTWATIVSGSLSRAALTGQVRATTRSGDIYRPVIGTYDRADSQRSNAADDVDVLRLNLAFAEAARLVKLAQRVYNIHCGGEVGALRRVGSRVSAERTESIGGGLISYLKCKFRVNARRSESRRRDPDRSVRLETRGKCSWQRTRDSHGAHNRDNTRRDATIVYQLRARSFPMDYKFRRRPCSCVFFFFFFLFRANKVAISAVNLCGKNYV